MSEQVVTMAPESLLGEVVAVMEQHHIQRVPIRNGREADWSFRSGRFSLRVLVDVAAECQVTVANDADLRADPAGDRESWSPCATIKIDVKDCIVKLWGTATDDRGRTALTVLAESVPGVGNVVDEMVGSNLFPAWCLRRRPGKRLKIRV